MDRGSTGGTGGAADAESDSPDMPDVSPDRPEGADGSDALMDGFDAPTETAADAPADADSDSRDGGDVFVADPRFGSGYWYENGTMRCGAVALNNWWVVTNHHCIGPHTWLPDETCYTPGAGSVVKFGGSRDWSTNPPVDHEWQQHFISSICRYPGNGEIGADERVDLALLRLDTPFSMNGADDDWQGLLWPTSSADLKGQTAICYGWGGASPELRSKQILYSKVDLPEPNPYFRGDRGNYSPALVDGDDSGSGCWAQSRGASFLATVTSSGSFGVSLSTDDYPGSDPFGPKLGVRDWMDSTMFHAPFSLGYSGLLNSGLGVSTQGKNRLDIFYVDSANTLRQIPYSGGWVDVSPDSIPLGASMGAPSLPPSSVSWRQGRIDIFTTGGGDLYHKWYDNSTWQQTWEHLVRPQQSVISSRPAVSSWGPYRMDVFVTATDSKVKHLSYENGWGSWEDLGGAINSEPAAASWSPGRTDVFARGTDNAIYHKFYESQWYPSQTDWENVGGNMSTSPTMTSYKDGRLDVFAQDASTGHLMHKWFELNWSSEWIDTGITVPSQPNAVSWGPGRIDIFATDANGGLWQTYFPR